MHLNETVMGKLAVSFIQRIKSLKWRWHVTDNKYFYLCPNSSTTYSLGKQRNEDFDKTPSEQQSCSSSCNLSHEKGFAKLNVAKF